MSTVESLLNTPTIDINWTGAESTGVTPLGAATEYNRVAMVQLLLRRGANPNIPADIGVTPLQVAAGNGSTEIVKLLIQGGADVNAADVPYGHTALASAARRGQVEVIMTLLDAGADRNLGTKDGRTPLDIAQHYGKDEAARVLYSYDTGAAAPVAQRHISPQVTAEPE